MVTYLYLWERLISVRNVMAFLKVDKGNIGGTEDGTLYIMRFRLRDEERTLYKIGICKGNRKPIDRMLEVLRGFWIVYEYTPDADLKRYRKVSGVFEKEAMMHRYCKKYKYVPPKKHDGSSELFIGIDEEELLSVYEDCIAGKDINVPEED